jgi:hypothetical protein
MPSVPAVCEDSGQLPNRRDLHGFLFRGSSFIISPSVKWSMASKRSRQIRSLRSSMHRPALA